MGSKQGDILEKQLSSYESSLTEMLNRCYVPCDVASLNTYCDDCLTEAQRAPAAVLPFILRLVVTQSIVFQHNPSVLPPVYVICPL